MPSWSIRYAGALTDQQINDIVNYLVHLNEENVAPEENKCITPEGRRRPSPRRPRAPPRPRRATRRRAHHRRPRPDARAGHLSRLQHRVRRPREGRRRTIAGLILFVGSIYVLLAAVMGRWMGYLLLSVAFWGWMIIQCSLWLFGFWSQGPETPVNLGPRGPEPAWTVYAAGDAICDDACRESEFAAFDTYPAGEWKPVTDEELSGSDAQAIQGAVTAYLAEEANHELGRDEFALDAVAASSFVDRPGVDVGRLGRDPGLGGPGALRRRRPGRRPSRSTSTRATWRCTAGCSSSPP